MHVFSAAQEILTPLVLRQQKHLSGGLGAMEAGNPLKSLTWLLLWEPILSWPQGDTCRGVTLGL